MSDSAPTATIPAEVHTDDWALEVPFDALPYFEAAADWELAGIVAEGFSHGYACDQVAQALATPENEIGRLFDYLELAHSRGPGDTVGFEVVIDEEAAKDWLRAHRPEVLEEPV